MQLPNSHLENQILRRLSGADFELLRTKLETVDLPVRQRLEIPHRPVSHVYFVEKGLISVVATGPGRRTIEVGVIGRESCTGQATILGSDRSPLETYVQASGYGTRIAQAHLVAAMKQSAALTALLLKACHAFTLQIAFTALASGQATLEQRLARWLLMAHDRLATNEIHLTHEFLAVVLGVRRPGVTVALSELQALGLVVIKRGSILIADRSGLETIANKYYGASEIEHLRLLGDSAEAPTL